jgi:serine/threonine protein kinase
MRNKIDIQEKEISKNKHQFISLSLMYSKVYPFTTQQRKELIGVILQNPYWISKLSSENMIKLKMFLTDESKKEELKELKEETKEKFLYKIKDLKIRQKNIIRMYNMFNQLNYEEYKGQRNDLLEESNKLSKEIVYNIKLLNDLPSVKENPYLQESFEIRDTQLEAEEAIRLKNYRKIKHLQNLQKNILEEHNSIKNDNNQQRREKNRLLDEYHDLSKEIDYNFELLKKKVFLNPKSFSNNDNDIELLYRNLIGGGVIPKDKKLYEKVKKLADKKFTSKSGIYRSSWIVREYKKRGGEYVGNKPKMSGLKRWYKENWIDLNRPIKNKKGKITGYKSCGRPEISKEYKYPLCRPSKRISSKTPKTYLELNKKLIDKAKNKKARVKGAKNIQFGGMNFDNLTMFIELYNKNPLLIEELLQFLRKNPNIISLNFDEDVNIQEMYPQIKTLLTSNPKLVSKVISFLKDNPNLIFNNPIRNLQFGGNENDDKELEVGDEIELFDGEIFRIVKILGQGSFKSALLAENITDSENKIVIFEQFIDLNKDLSLQKQQIINFKREIKIMKEIVKKTNDECLTNIICPLFTQEPEIFKNGQIQHGYIITNYFSGQDLFSFLFDNQELDNSYLQNSTQDISLRTIKIMKSIADVFSIFHNQIKFAHLDIKPENIMINENDEISIIDIGHACNVTDIECYSGGTPAYIAPEIYHLKHRLEDFEIVKKADIWSLGCVFYDLIFQDYTPIGEIIDYNNPYTINKIVESVFNKNNFKFKPVFGELVYTIIIPMLNQKNMKRPDIQEIADNLDILYQQLLKTSMENKSRLTRSSGKMNLPELIERINKIDTLNENEISTQLQRSSGKMNLPELIERINKIEIINENEEFSDDEPEVIEQKGGKKQFFGKKSSVMVKIPSNVRKWADHAFELKKAGFKGALETGWKRAKQLSNNEFIPIEDLRYMRNWYARHIYTSYPGFKEWVDAGQPMDNKWHNKRAIQSWITWGANAGFKWVNSDKVINLLNKHFGTDYKKIKNPE